MVLEVVLAAFYFCVTDIVLIVASGKIQISFSRDGTGLDYLGAAPVSGMRYGHGTENRLVKLQVEQQE